MTTPESHDDPSETTASSTGGSHSAPRPAAELDLTDNAAAEGATTGEKASDAVAPLTGDGALPADSPESNAPTRISAFPAIGRTMPQVPPLEETEPTTALPVTPTAAPSPVATTAPSVATFASTGATAQPEAAQTAVVPLATEASLAGSTGGTLREGRDEQARTFPEEEWAESTKRTAAHLWGVLGVLVAAPIAWFLLTDGALRTFYSLESVSSSPNIAGLLSLAGGLIALLVIALIARASSLGGWIFGGLIALAGIAFLAVPRIVLEWLMDSREGFLSLHEGFGTNLYNYLADTGRSGLLLTFGLVVVLFSLISHGTRRSGRHEGQIKADQAARERA